jgi:2-polyprenyl-3-methyl-5-hydroxy-6-metoxy-1,4-benzoquinol methylase
VRQCCECGALEFIKQSAAPLEEIYSRSYFHGEEYVNYDSYAPSHRRNFRKKIDLLRAHSHLPEHLRVIEVGAATGEFYQALIRYPKIQMERYLGLEVSEYARQEAISRGIRVISPLTPTAQQEISEFRPNLIVAWDVWEHLEDPVAIFDSLIESAEPDATVAISTVDFGAFVPQMRGPKWRQYHPPTHLNYPTRKSFQRYFQSRGFTISYLASFGSYRPLAEYLKVVRLPLTSQLPKTVRELPIYLNTFDTQLVIASRSKKP